jgi:hypothetical protein
MTNTGTKTYFVMANFLEDSMFVVLLSSIDYTSASQGGVYCGGLQRAQGVKPRRLASLSGMAILLLLSEEQSARWYLAPDLVT